LRALIEARIMIVGWKPNSSEFLRAMLSALGRPAFTRVSNTDEALGLLREQGFELVFCTEDCEPLPPAAFVRAVRRDQYSRHPTVPIVIISKGGTAKDIDALRAAGVDDIMRPPLSADAIEKRLHRVLLQPRSFIACKAFVGPDRRRSERTFEGEDRRAEEVRFYQLPPVVGTGKTITVIDATTRPADDVFICDV
jgi:CheY-like chemotaxis protein